MGLPKNYSLTGRYLSVELLACFLIAVPISCRSNGYGESYPWTFRTDADRGNLVGVADVIEKKQGGYYDGFTTIVHSTNSSTTNIGTQVNCNTIADATGNIADNSQLGNTPVQDAKADLSADTIANKVDGYTGENASAETNAQDNSGDLTSSVDGSSVSSSTGAITTGDANNDLTNTQDNSGNQNANVDGSTTCDMSGGNLDGIVEINGDNMSANGRPLN